MARITKADQELTPIYFQTRRETKWDVPLVALPKQDRVLANLEEWYDSNMKNVCSKCGREKGCDSDCEDMNCEHCYCYRDGRDG